MKNKFLNGFFSGLAATIVIMAIVVTVFANKINENITRENASVKTENTSASKTEVTDQDILKKIEKLQGLIGKYYMEDVDKNTMAEGIYKGLLSSLKDPYSIYYTKEEYAALMESSSGIYCGIGATVSADAKTGVLSIVKPFVDGPAYKAGILPGDILYKVNGEEVTGKDLAEVVGKIKGEEGTKVKVTIVREGKTDPIDYTITRKKVEVPTIEYQMLDGKIGYIAVSEFDEVTAEQFRSAVDDLEKQGEKGLVIDIRNNPGGLLDTVVDMLKRMLPSGMIVYTEDKYGNRDEYKGDGKEEFKKPLAVLINGNSASASEIFAGAIQDYKKGTLVGTTSFGKGIVQSILPLNDGTAIKVTVSKYYTPKGRNIHKIGITPDVTVELKDSLRQKVIIDKSEDNQLQKALQILNKQIKASK